MIGKTLLHYKILQKLGAFQIDDGSWWKIRPSDSGKTTLWFETQRIVVDRSADHLYPYRLANLDTPSWEEGEAAPL